MTPLSGQSPFPGGYFRGNVQLAKAVSRVQKIVRLTEYANVLSSAPPKLGKRCDVIEFERDPSIAAPTIYRYVPALPALSLVNFSPHAHG